MLRSVEYRNFERLDSFKKSYQQFQLNTLSEKESGTIVAAD
jgi:hypothetical protein